jgi:hypothetical protein
VNVLHSGLSRAYSRSHKNPGSTFFGPALYLAKSIEYEDKGLYWSVIASSTCQVIVCRVKTGYMKTYTDRKADPELTEAPKDTEGRLYDSVLALPDGICAVYNDDRVLPIALVSFSNTTLEALGVDTVSEETECVTFPTATMT